MSGGQRTPPSVEEAAETTERTPLSMSYEVNHGRETFTVELEEAGQSNKGTYVKKKKPLSKVVWSKISAMLVAGKCSKPKSPEERTIRIGEEDDDQDYPPNIVRNQKYSVASFIPISLYEQFKYFFNMYFLVVAISQFFPPLQVGFLFTYVAPLAFVVAIALLKEAYDDFQRYLRDKEANSEKYEAYLGGNKWGAIESSEVTVGMIIKLSPNQRIPADCLLLKTTEKDGSFIRTDQLDGETDWKLRIPLSHTQSLSDIEVPECRRVIWAEAPHRQIYEFVGSSKADHCAVESESEPLSLENTLWANCILATGHVLALVIYTGKETRSSMNANQPSSKIGLIDLELNYLSKLLCVLTAFLALLMISFQRFVGEWYISFFRFVLLFSSIIPISLRVNLDMGKAVYSFFIMTDKKIQGVVVRNSNLPEELGRIGYLFSDKTGTLTKNEMEFKKLFTGEDVPRGWLHSDLGEMQVQVSDSFERLSQNEHSGLIRGESDFVHEASKRQMEELSEAVTALAVAHNVTPVVDADTFLKEYQASSPDEVALVKFCESVGMILEYRDRKTMSIRSHSKTIHIKDPMTVSQDKFGHQVTSAKGSSEEYLRWYITMVGNHSFDHEEDINETIQTGIANGGIAVKAECRINYDILLEFPFTSESKRMGIVVRHRDSKEIRLFMKGADTKMAEIVNPTPWLEEECSNLAREGLRTLVFGARTLLEDEFDAFMVKYNKALRSRDPKSAVEKIRVFLEKDLQLVCVTGVEDKLQDDVALTLEHLRKAGIKIWMLTGDKVETATCIARSTRLVAKEGGIFPFDCESARFNWLWDREGMREGWRPGNPIVTEQHALDYLESFEKYVESGSTIGGVTMIIDGKTLEMMLHVKERFVIAAGKATTVVVARCSPTQKAEVVETMKQHLADTKSTIRTSSIGDGGNDVSMILASDVGLGIEGKEGRHASLAADFSLVKFSHCLRLITWHGRNSYKRSARLSQFVIHRGLIISIIQCIFSAIFYFMSVPIYTGWLLVGYSTVYTMFPVFAIVLDEDISEETAYEFPELYSELQKSRCLNIRTFLQWVFKATYQGGTIMLLSIVLFESSFIRIVTMTFTALISTELITVWFEMHSIPWPFVVSELLSVLVYFISFFFIDTLDLQYVSDSSFWWKTGVITAAATFPVTLAKFLERACCESSYSKLKEKSEPWFLSILQKIQRKFSKGGASGGTPSQPLLF
eukprot:TRINITY_DN13533_c0_g1_i2.p1 TRINITY_DN13533_c0_g1~~TRINITY_DN13533_c0_g1_i2.p1  ORF type:complete len:1216 (+),score=261.43 TRINITY_DN13533_c0_g1_i2:203-3850(+)